MNETKALFDAAEEKVIRDGYQRFASRTVAGEERIAGLLAKLREEVEEVEQAHASGIPHAFIEELGDVVEVCFALGGYDVVEDSRNAKLEDLGGFNDGLVMRLADRTQPCLTGLSPSFPSRPTLHKPPSRSPSSSRSPTRCRGSAR